MLCCLLLESGNLARGWLSVKKVFVFFTSTLTSYRWYKRWVDSLYKNLNADVILTVRFLCCSIFIRKFSYHLSCSAATAACGKVWCDSNFNARSERCFQFWYRHSELLKTMSQFFPSALCASRRYPIIRRQQSQESLLLQRQNHFSWPTNRVFLFKNRQCFTPQVNIFQIQ